MAPLFLTVTNGIWRKRYSGGCCLTVKGFKTLSKPGYMLESQTAFLAAQRVTAENIEAIEETLRGMEASIGQPEKYLEFDLQFHLTIARATQNSILYSLLSMIRGYLQEWIKGSLD